MDERVSDSETIEVEKSAKAEYIKCSSCGSNMVFDPSTQMLYCEHCGSKMTFDKNKEVEEIAIEKAFEATEVWNDTAVLRCENCGAQITIERGKVALGCPYCGTSHVRETDEIAGVKPNAVYPFTITADEAVRCSKKWAKSRIFSPRKFKKNLEEKQLRGVYQPCFTFDSYTTSAYSGRLGERRTRVIHTKDGTKTETYIHYFRVRGTISLSFDDITISASQTIPQSTLDSLLPFNRNSICVYEQKFLAGYCANHYDKDVKKSWDEAKQRMDKAIRDAIVRKYNADVVDSLSVSTTHTGVTYKYVLFPLYLLSYHYKKKDYKVMVNGNTGKVKGKAPISFWRVLTAILLGAGLLVGLYFVFRGTDSSSAMLQLVKDVGKLIK